MIFYKQRRTLRRSLFTAILNRMGKIQSQNTQQRSRKFSTRTMSQSITFQRAVFDSNQNMIFQFYRILGSELNEIIFPKNHHNLHYQQLKSMSSLIQHYTKCHLKQLHHLFKKGYYSQLLLCSDSPPSFRIPSLIACKMFEEAAMQSFEDQEHLNVPVNLIWLIMSSHMIGMDFEEYSEQLKKHDVKYKQIIEDWIKTAKPLHHPSQIKILLRTKFEELVQKSSKDNYFLMPKVPGFLVSTKWLQELYSSNGDYIGAVNNLELFEPLKYIDTQPKNMHLNYKIKSDLRENKDYKIISYQAWMFLQDNFGGIQFRRYNTNEKQPTCQTHLKSLKVFLVIGRYVIGNEVLELLASRNDTIASVIQRLKRLIISYQLLSFSEIKKAKWEVMKSSNLTEDQIFDILHSEELQLSKDFSKINQDASLEMINHTFDIEEAEYYSETDFLIINLNLSPQISSAIKTQKIPMKKSNQLKIQCLTCKRTDDLMECICKSAFFCSKYCKQYNKEHEKICKDLLKEDHKIQTLCQFYNVRKTVLNYDTVKSSGKVGLENLGNTCYMNSALQCVINLSFLTKYLISNEYLKEINPTNILGSEGHLVCSYGQFIKQYYTTRRRSLEPSKILKIIAKNPQFRGYNHQDSQQFLNYFLDKLHEDLNRIKKKPYTQDIESDGRPDHIVSAQSWENYLKRNDSFLSQHLAGQYRSEIRCPDCKRISITFDPYLSVTLVFPKQEKKVQIVGYFLSKYGEFRKVAAKVPATTSASAFVDKYFHTKAFCLYAKNKKPQREWAMSKSVYYNHQDTGIQLFYELPESYETEISVFYEGYQILPRKFFYETPIQNQQQLLNKMYLASKIPVLKATANEEILSMSDDQYLKIALQTNFIEIANNQQPEFPLKGRSNIKLRFKFSDQSDSILQPKNKFKFDISSGEYVFKNQLKTRSINDQLNISAMIASFSEPEQLTQENAWYCNKCKDHKLAEKKMEIYKTPEYLILHLKRFNHSGNRYVIYGEKVKTPINVQPYQTINGKKYELLGYVNHFGSLSFGHYTATVKQEGSWYYCDDSSVRKSNLDGSNAYILFYKCVDGQK